jgi:LysM repeat protein
MNRNLRRSMVIALLFLLILASLAACQRERPAAEEETWSTSPIVEASVTPAAAETPTGLGPEATTVAVEGGQPAAQATPGAAVEAQPVSTPLLPAPTEESSGVVAAVGPTFEYIVKPGDTLFSIALTYDTDVETLRQLNNLPDDTIQSGQTVLVPGSGETAQASGQTESTPVAAQEEEKFIYVVQTGDNLSSIADQFGVDWRDIAAVNNIEPPTYTIYRGMKLEIPGVTPTPIPTAEVTIHVVKAGDTLYSIAVQYGVTLQAIMQANQITNPDLIRQGQEIIIPQQ